MYSTLFLVALCAVKLKRSSLLLIFRGREAGTDSSALVRNVFVKHSFLSRIVFKNKVCEILNRDIGAEKTWMENESKQKVTSKFH